RRGDRRGTSCERGAVRDAWERRGSGTSTTVAERRCEALSHVAGELVSVGRGKVDCKPEGGADLTGESWLTTTFDKIEEWAQTRSFWPLPFDTACCAIEFMGVVSSHYDVARFGYEVVRFSPRQSDILIVAGTITDKMGPVLKKIYDQMPEDRQGVVE